jgi:acetyl esterase/lipase
VPIQSLREPELTAALREIGPIWHRDIRAAGDRVRALYQPYLAAAPRGGVEVIRDVAYGGDPRQVLDVYRPSGARSAPVVVFVHGGAFIRGDRNVSDEIYANVLVWFARHGYVGVNIEYRLAPQAPYPCGAEDVALACRWIVQNIAGHGGDPAKLLLIGHSAGGTHVATCLSDPALAAVRPDVSAAVLISARLRADTLAANPNAGGVQAYFGMDESLYAPRSPVTYASRLAVPALVVNAEYENPLLDRYGLEYAAAVAAHRQNAPVHLALMDHNHISIVAHFNTREQLLGEQILVFFDRSV